MMKILDLAFITVWFFQFPLSSSMPSGFRAVVPYLVLSAYLLSMALLEGRWVIHSGSRKTMVKTLLLSLLYLFLSYEPLVIVHSSSHVPSILTSLLTLSYYLLVAGWIQVMIFNHNVKTSYKLPGRKRDAILPLVSFFMLLMPYQVMLPMLSESPAHLFVSFTSYFPQFLLLYLVMLYLFVKSKFDNISGFIFYGFYSIPVIFSAVYHSQYVLAFIWPFVLLGTMLLVIEIGYPESAYLRRSAKLKRRQSSHRRNADIMRSIVLISVSLLAFFIVFPVVMQTPHPFMTDPTGSMEPVIQPNSLLVVRGVSPSDIHVGSIVVFTAPWNSNLTIAHEVIAISRTGNSILLHTKGLANALPDPLPVPMSNVHGIVITIIPLVGLLFLYSTSVIALITMIGTSFVLVSILPVAGSNRARLQLTPSRKLKGL